MPFLIICLVVYSLAGVSNLGAFIESGHPHNLIISVLLFCVGGHQLVNYALTRQLRDLREHRRSDGDQ